MEADSASSERGSLIVDLVPVFLQEVLDTNPFVARKGFCTNQCIPIASRWEIHAKKSFSEKKKKKMKKKIEKKK